MVARTTVVGGELCDDVGSTAGSLTETDLEDRPLGDASAVAEPFKSLLRVGTKLRDALADLVREAVGLIRPGSLRHVAAQMKQLQSRLGLALLLALAACSGRPADKAAAQGTPTEGSGTNPAKPPAVDPAFAAYCDNIVYRRDSLIHLLEYSYLKPLKTYEAEHHEQRPDADSQCAAAVSSVWRAYAEVHAAEAMWVVGGSPEASLHSRSWTRALTSHHSAAAQRTIGSGWSRSGSRCSPLHPRRFVRSLLAALPTESRSVNDAWRS